MSDRFKELHGEIAEPHSYKSDALEAYLTNDDRQTILDALRMASEGEARESAPCQICSLPVVFEFTAASPIWNKIVRDSGTPEYICFWCFDKLAIQAGAEQIPIGVNLGGKAVHSEWCGDDVPGAYNEETKTHRIVSLEAELAAERKERILTWERLLKSEEWTDRLNVELAEYKDLLGHTATVRDRLVEELEAAKRERIELEVNRIAREDELAKRVNSFERENGLLAEALEYHMPPVIASFRDETTIRARKLLAERKVRP